MPLPKDPRVVVTGAGSGLGRAFCGELARRGARILASDIDETAVRETVASLSGCEAHVTRCDVTVLADVEAMADDADRVLGGVDLVINNAGVAVGGRVGEIPIDSWEWIVAVNLWGPIYGCHVFAPRLRRQGRGHILNVASAAGLLASPNMAPYNVTKSGVVALSETLAAELTPEGIGVSVLCPTFFQTNIAKSSRLHADDGQLLGMVERLMAQASVQASDVARIALDGVAADELYIVPHTDGLWAWRFKRLNPTLFQSLTARFLAWRAGRSA